MAGATTDTTMARNGATNGKVKKKVSEGTEMGATSGKGRGSSTAQKSEKPGVKPGPGRPLSSNQAYIDAIKAQYPPGRLVDMMQEAFDMAVETNSWRGMVAVMEFAANYSLGKPVKRVESSGDTSLADLLAGVDTSKPLLSIGYDKGQYHKLSSDGDGGNLAGDVSGPGEIMSSDGEGVDE
jgi:hypothetical protein